MFFLLQNVHDPDNQQISQFKQAHLIRELFVFDG